MSDSREVAALLDEHLRRYKILNANQNKLITDYKSIIWPQLDQFDSARFENSPDWRKSELNKGWQKTVLDEKSRFFCLSTKSRFSVLEEELNDGRLQVIRRFVAPSDFPKTPNPEKILIDLSPETRTEAELKNEREEMARVALNTRTDYELFDAAIDLITGNEVRTKDSSIKKEFRNVLTEYEKPIGRAKNAGQAQKTTQAINKSLQDIYDQYDNDGDLF